MRHYKRYTTRELETLYNCLSEPNGKAIIKDVFPEYRTTRGLYCKISRMKRSEIPSIQFISENIPNEVPTRKEVALYRKSKEFPEDCSVCKQKLLERMIGHRYPFDREDLLKIISIHNDHATSMREIFRIARAEGVYTTRKRITAEIKFLLTL